MGTLFEWKFEGQSNGTPVTAANSDDFGDPAWTAISLSLTTTYSTAQARYGTVSLRSVISAGTAIAADKSDTAANSSATSCWLRLVSYPSVATILPERSRDSVGAANLASTQITTTGQVQAISGATTGTASVTTLALDTWYRLEAVTTAFNSGSTLRTINVYDTTGALFLGPVTATGTTAALCNMIRWLKSGSAANLEYFLDDPRQNIGATAEIGARIQSITIGAALETSQAQPLARVKGRPLGVATEASTAWPLGRRKFRTLAAATEVDTAQAVLIPGTHRVYSGAATITAPQAGGSAVTAPGAGAATVTANHAGEARVQ